MLKITARTAIGVDPDQTAPEQSHLGLHCLEQSDLGMHCLLKPLCSIIKNFQYS